MTSRKCRLIGPSITTARLTGSQRGWSVGTAPWELALGIVFTLIGPHIAPGIAELTRFVAQGRAASGGVDSRLRTGALIIRAMEPCFSTAHSQKPKCKTVGFSTHRSCPRATSRDVAPTSCGGPSWKRSCSVGNEASVTGDVGAERSPILYQFDVRVAGGDVELLLARLRLRPTSSGAGPLGSLAGE